MYSARVFAHASLTDPIAAASCTCLSQPFYTQWIMVYHPRCLRFPVHPMPLAAVWPVDFLFAWFSFISESSKRGRLAPVLSHHRAYRSVHGGFNSCDAPTGMLQLNRNSRNVPVFLCHSHFDRCCVTRPPVTFPAVSCLPGHLNGTPNLQRFRIFVPGLFQCFHMHILIRWYSHWFSSSMSFFMLAIP